MAVFGPDVAARNEPAAASSRLRGISTWQPRCRRDPSTDHPRPAPAAQVANRENELVAFTAGSFLALALHSLAPQALATLEGFEGKGAKAAHAAWMVCLVAFIVKFLLFVGELEESAHGGEL